MRRLDYFDKDLSIADRQKLFQCLNTDISKTMMRYFLEKETGYPSFHSCGFTDENIKTIWDEVYYEKVCKVNHILAANGLPPLFSDPYDPYRSAREYFDALSLL